MKQTKSKHPKQSHKVDSQNQPVSDVAATKPDNGQAAPHFDTTSGNRSSNTNIESPEDCLGNDLQTDSRPNGGV